MAELAFTLAIVQAMEKTMTATTRTIRILIPMTETWGPGKKENVGYSCDPIFRSRIPIVVVYIATSRWRNGTIPPRRGVDAKI